MIVDITVIIDDDPVVFRLPLLPYTFTTYRVPLFAAYNPQATDWPTFPYYFTERTADLSTILVSGIPHQFTNNRVPHDGQFTIHSEASAAFIVIGFQLSSMVMWRRPSIIGTEEVTYSQFGTQDRHGNRIPPMITQMPDVRKKADALKYARFSFDSIRLSFIKENQSIFLFGGQMVVDMKLKDDQTNDVKDFFVGRYVLDNIEHDMNIARMGGIDFRYMLNVKYPTETFSRDSSFLVAGEEINAPFLEDEYIDTVIPECIGVCNGVPGIPLNGLQIYSDATFSSYEDWICYQFPPGWTHLFKIEYSVGDEWVEIWPGLGNPWAQSTVFPDNYRNSHPPATHPRFAANSSNNHHSVFSANGRVWIYWTQARQNGARNQGTNKVRMFARWPRATMFQAISYLLSLARNDGLIQGFAGEFAGLAQIGLYMGESKSLFEWIEQLQSANIIGGQLLVRNDALFFKLENPNRLKALDINSTDVLNHETLGVEIADDFVYSGWDISYIKSHQDNDTGHNIGSNYRYPTAQILDSHDNTVFFVYSGPRNQFFDTRHLNTRVHIIRDLIATFRHRIVGLEVPMYFKYMNLEIYDVVGYLPKVLEAAGSVEYEWVIYEKRLNMRRETITFTLVERKRSPNWNQGNP